MAKAQTSEVDEIWKLNSSYIKEMGFCSVDWIHLAQDGPCEHCSEPSCSIEEGHFLD
jgi:hypothetical protein